jgi:subtilisin family serine protease
MKFSKAAYVYYAVFIICWWMPVLYLHAQIQVAPDRYRVEFTDKKHNVYTISQPQNFLSERALQRRERQGIAVSQADLPVSVCYIDSLKQLGFEVLNSSRWFNSATIRSSQENLEKLNHVSFIKHTPVIQKEKVQDTTVDKGYDFKTSFSFLFRKKNEEEAGPKYNAPVEYYGMAADQVGMMNGQALHDRGFRGKGMLVAVIDGGFYKVMELSGFDSLRNSGRLRETKNFTPDFDTNTSENNHGTNVLSIIASNLPGRMIGSAPDADYVLLRSEEINHEYIVEEDNWIAAVEYADSIGVDLITSSLGYTTFDDVSQNHSYCELDGRTIRASQAAAMAAGKGMIVCVSAGNDGETNWKYISVPADADSVITIGAVDREARYASFSSKGYTSDKRIKPDLVAMGKETAYQHSIGNINTGNGTSYSTPLLAGLITCLWQAFPDKSNMEIMDMLKRSASHFQEPDSLYGYGIPDFSKLLPFSSLSSSAKNESYTVSVLTDPHKDTFKLYLSPARHGHVHILIKTLSGQQILSHSGYVSNFNGYELSVNDTANFTPGMYWVEVRTDAGKVTVKNYNGMFERQ